MNYFKDCKTKDEAKKKFRELAMKLHPDHGGTTKEMIELQRQYDAFDTHDFKKDGKYYNDGYTNSNASSKGEYGGYGGYSYRTTSNMRNEYFNQRDDPRLADYENMKAKYHEAMSVYQHNLNENRMQRCEIYRLKDEIDKLKKKIERIKAKVSKPPKPPKEPKKPLTRLSKKKEKDLESVISL